MTTTVEREEIIRGIQDYCADLHEAGGWNKADALVVAGMLNASGDGKELFRYLDEKTGSIDVGYRTRDGREWFLILREMRNSAGSGLLENLG